MLTIPEVLRRAGHPAGRCVSVSADRWRTTCPVHRGDNQESFSYTRELWHCFTCGESGGIVALAERLRVLERRDERPAIEGMPDLRMMYQRDRTRVVERVTQRLERLGSEYREEVGAVADAIHQACEQAQASDIPRYLDAAAITYQNDPDGRLVAFETAADWWDEVVAWRDVAHALYAFTGLDPRLAAWSAGAAYARADDARFCPCQGVAWPAQGTRARPRLA